MSVAVVIVNQDAYISPTEDGESGISPEELARLTEVVKGGFGFSESRGDTRCRRTVELCRACGRCAKYPRWEDSSIVDLIKYGSSLVPILLILIFVARPIIRANMPVSDDFDIPLASDGRGVVGSRFANDQTGEGETLEEIKAKLEAEEIIYSIDMLDTANSYDDKVAVLHRWPRMIRRVANSIKRMIKAQRAANR